MMRTSSASTALLCTAAAAAIWLSAALPAAAVAPDPPSCTKADRGIDSFSCPVTAETPTGDICGAGPSYTCFVGEEPCNFTKETFNCTSCTCQCIRSSYPCDNNPGYCTAAISDPAGQVPCTGGNCPTGGVWLDRCAQSPGCPSNYVKCQDNSNPAPGRCVVNNAAKCNAFPGTTWDPCTDQCSSPYIIRNSSPTQANASIDIDGDILAGGNITATSNLISGDGDLYLNSGKAIRVDGLGPNDDGITELYVGNWLPDAGVSVDSRFNGRIMSFSGVIDGDYPKSEYPLEVKSYSLGLGSGNPENTAIISLSDMTDGSLWTGLRLARGLDPNYPSWGAPMSTVEKWFIGLRPDEDTLRFNFKISDNEGGYYDQVLALTPSSGVAGGLMMSSEEGGSAPTVNAYLSAANRPSGGCDNYGTCWPADPDGTGVSDGLIYYNTTMAKLRCFEDGEWKNCVTDGGLGGAGQGEAGQVAVWQDESAMFGTPDLFWDNDNGRLGIGTNTPGSRLSVMSGADFSTTTAIFDQSGTLEWYGEPMNSNVVKVHRSFTASSTGPNTGALMLVEDDSEEGGSMGNILEVKANRNGRGIYSQSNVDEAGYFEQSGSVSWNSTPVVKIVRDLVMGSTSSGSLLSLENNSQYSQGTLFEIINNESEGYYSDYMRVTDAGGATVFAVDRDGTVQANAFRLSAGAGAGKLLTSDASGNGSWSLASAVANECSGGIYDHAGPSSTGSMGGYAGANTKCAGGTHICTTQEILRTFICYPASLPASGSFWYANGGPGFTAPASNDCQGWTNNTTGYGDFWQFDASGGKSFATACTVSWPIACCRK